MCTYLYLINAIETIWVLLLLPIYSDTTYNFVNIIIPPPQNVGGGLYWIRFVASVGPSVGRSVRLQFLSAL